jgi:hypothetical protein
MTEKDHARRIGIRPYNDFGVSALSVTQLTHWQAIMERIPILTVDPKFDSYDVRIIR